MCESLDNEIAEKRNRELEESVPKEKERLQRQFAKQVEEEAEKKIQPFVKREIENKRQQEELK